MGGAVFHNKNKHLPQVGYDLTLGVCSDLPKKYAAYFRVLAEQKSDPF